MKRENTKYYITEHTPWLFWYQCLFCDKEFRRERGFKFILRNSQHSYSCGSCCSSVSHCHENIEHFFTSSRERHLGNVPPPPPMRSYNKKVVES